MCDKMRDTNLRNVGLALCAKRDSTPSKIEKCGGEKIKPWEVCAVSKVKPHRRSKPGKKLR